MAGPPPGRRRPGEDLTEALVLSGGLDYRSAYQVVARAVAACDDAGEPLDAARLAEAAREVLGRALTVDPAVLATARRLVG